MTSSSRRANIAGLMILVAAYLITVGCTQNQLAKHYGGTAVINLPVNAQLTSVTFKDANIWVLMKQRPVGQKPEIHTFKEYSNFGALEGTVIFQEK